MGFLVFKNQFIEDVENYQRSYAQKTGASPEKVGEALVDFVENSINAQLDALNGGILKFQAKKVKGGDVFSAVGEIIAFIKLSDNTSLIRELQKLAQGCNPYSSLFRNEFLSLWGKVNGEVTIYVPVTIKTLDELPEQLKTFCQSWVQKTTSEEGIVGRFPLTFPTDKTREACYEWVRKEAYANSNRSSDEMSMLRLYQRWKNDKYVVKVTVPEGVGKILKYDTGTN